MKLFYSRESTPLIFHNFTHYVTLPIGILVQIYNIITVISFHSLDTGNIALFFLYMTQLVLPVICFVGFLHWKQYAWRCFMAYLVLMPIYYSIWLFLFSHISHELVISGIEKFGGSLVYSILAGIYYLKRMPLFANSQMKDISASSEYYHAVLETKSIDKPEAEKEPEDITP